MEGVIWRYRVGVPWRDVPTEFGPWQTLWKRHRRYSGDGTWDKVLAVLLAEADAADRIDWSVSVDSTISRAHQHAANLTRDTGGPIELSGICWPSCLTMRSAVHEGVCRPRSVTSSMAAGCHWSC